MIRSLIKNILHIITFYSSYAYYWYYKMFNFNLYGIIICSKWTISRGQPVRVDGNINQVIPMHSLMSQLTRNKKIIMIFNKYRFYPVPVVLTFWTKTVLCPKTTTVKLHITHSYSTILTITGWGVSTISCCIGSTTEAWRFKLLPCLIFSTNTDYKVTLKTQHENKYN